MSPEVSPEASPVETPEATPEITPEATPEASLEPSPAALVPKGEDSGACGDNLTWYYYYWDGTLTITGTGAMYDFTQSTSIAYNHRGSIKRVVIGSGVTSVGAYAFYNDYNMTSVSLPSGLASIGSYAFGKCNALTGVNTARGHDLDWYVRVCPVQRADGA